MRRPRVEQRGDASVFRARFSKRERRWTFGVCIAIIATLVCIAIAIDDWDGGEDDRTWSSMLVALGVFPAMGLMRVFVPQHAVRISPRSLWWASTLGPKRMKLNWNDIVAVRCNGLVVRVHDSRILYLSVATSTWKDRAALSEQMMHMLASRFDFADPTDYERWLMPRRHRWSAAWLRDRLTLAGIAILMAAGPLLCGLQSLQQSFWRALPPFLCFAIAAVIAIRHVRAIDRQDWHLPRRANC